MVLEQCNRHNGAFAGAGRRFDHRVTMTCKSRAQRRPDFIYWQAGFHDGRIIPLGPVLTSVACVGDKPEQVKTSMTTADGLPEAVAAA
jgi:hypothetical protein